jgi:hypothetical protein
MAVFQEARVTRKIPEAAWALELHRFTNRNAGRVTTLDVGSPDFGAQSRQRGFPLRAISYDAHDDQVLITLGDQAHAAQHLTHTIAQASAIYVLIDVRGRDEALAVQQDGIHTLLRFVD